MPLLVRLVSRPYLRLLGYTGMSFSGEKEARRLWSEFAAGRVRLVVAFRHALGNDPQLTTAAVLRGIRVAGQRPFVQFVHGVEVGWWAGALARWILPRIGGLPVDHDARGAEALDKIRAAIVSGAHPLALAPEGQITYEARSVQRVMPGFARLGYLAAEDLAVAGRPESVLVLPLSFHHIYPRGTSRRIEKAVGRLELAVAGSASSGDLGPRLTALRDGLFERAEDWYARNHRHRPVEGPWSRHRALALLESALAAGEDALGLPHEGEFFVRLYRLRSSAWSRFYRPRDTWKSLTTLERGLAAREQTEAWTAFRHLELADIGWYLWSVEPRDDSATDFLADFTENLYDLMNRLMGGTIAHRKVLFPKAVRAVFGSPLDLTARLPDYRTRRKEVLAETVADLIKEWNRG